MRTTHKFTLRHARIVLLVSMLFVASGLVFAFAPIASVAAARQSMAVRLSANPVISKVLSLAPGSILKALGLKSLNVGMANAPAAALDNNESITVSAVPPSGSTVEPGGVIAYNIVVTNGPGADVNPQITVRIPAGTRFQSVAIGGSNPNNFLGPQCAPPAFNTLGPASFTCGTASNAFVQGNLVITLVVRVENPYTVGGPINNNATYQDLDNDGSPFPILNSNTVTHNVATAAGPPADLSVVKTADKTSVLAGGGNPAGRITYTLFVRNNGPNTANGVAVFDEVPVNTNLVSGPTWSGTSPGTCITISGGKFYCRPTATDAVLPAGGNATVTYAVEVPANVPEGAAITNVALVSSYKEIITTPGVNTSPDPTPTNNLSLTSTRVRAEADLSVSYDQSSGPNPVCAGAITSLTIKVTNSGPSDAQNVVFTNLIHPNLFFPFNTFVSVSTFDAPGFSCSTPSVGGNGSLTCTAATMPANSMASFIVRVGIRPEYTGNISFNLSNVTSGTFDPNMGPNNNQTTFTINVNQCADVEVVSKLATAFPSGPAAVDGEKLVYDMVVRNNGPSDAQNVVFSDPIPAGTTFDSVSATGVFAGRCNDVVTCAPADGIFPAGATANIRVVVKIDPNRTPPVVNTATITTATGDPNPTNNSKQVSTPVIRRTDVSVKKTGPATVTAGNQYTYTIVVRNDGPSDAPPLSVTLSDNLNGNTTFQGAFAVGDGTFSCTNAANAVTCRNNSTFDAGGASTITIVFRVNNNVQPNTIIPNTALVTSPNDPNPDNNTSTTSTAGATSADLQLTKTASPGPVIAGSGTITYVIEIANSGPSNANGVTVTDNIPANTTLVTNPPIWTPLAGSPPPPGSCTVSAGGTITCRPSSANNVLAVGQRARITYTVSVPASALNGTLVTNGAVIASTGPNTTPDPNPANNTQDPTSTLIITRADLVFDKTDVGAGLGPDPVVAGTIYKYRMRINNAGPSDAQNVVAVDQMNPVLSFEAIDASAAPGFTCQTPPVGSSGTITCSRGVIPPGAANYDIVITTRIRPNTAPGVYAVDGFVTSSTIDPNLANNSDTETVTVIGSADLELVSKTDSPDPMVAGQNLTYTITFRNNGPSAAFGVAISDTIPVNTTFVAVSAPVGFSCTVPAVGAGNPAVVTCSPPGGAAPAGAIAEIRLAVKVSTNPSSLTISNTASIATSGVGATSDPNSGNNSKTETTSVIRRTDLDLKKTGPAVVTAGNTYTYTMVVRNDGPSDAPGGTVTVSDTLSANLTFNSASATGDGGFTCSNVANAVTCSNGALFSAGGKATITFTFTVNQGVPQNTIIANTATVSSTNDPNAANNTSTTSTAGQTSADLQLTKTASPGSVIAGSLLPADEITYTMSVLNSGPSVANGVVVSDVVPANTVVTTHPTFTSTGSPAIAMTCTAASPGAQFTCVITGGGPMPVGAAGTILYKVRVPANVALNTIVTNQATIASVGASATPDPNPSNNTQDPTSTLVNTSANLSITKSDTPDPVTAGANLTYTLTVANAGPSDAQNVVVTDTLPAQVSFVSVASSDPGFVCVNANNTVTCSKATLAASASATITIVAKVNPNTPNGTTLTNSATVGSTTSDPAAGNNSTSSTTTVNTNAVFTIVKSDNPDPVIAGANLSYRVTLTNNGPSDAQSVVLTDALPNTPSGAVSFISVSGTGVFAAAGACTHSAGVITCTATPGGVMPAGATAHVDILLKVNSNVPAGTVLTNTAVVTSPTSTQTAIARTATETTTVRHQSDLSLVKDAPPEVIAGTRIDYKLTIENLGPSDVLGGAAPGTITIVDDLPAGVMPVDLQGQPLSGTSVPIVLSGPGGFTCSYDMATNRVTCRNAAGSAGNFPVGSVATIIFKVKTASGLPDGTNLVNCAEIILPIVTSDPTAAPETDPNGGNNRSCDATVVRTSADLGVSKTATPVPSVPGRPDLPVVTLPASPPGAVKAGGYIRYDVPFGNAGPSDSANVRLTDPVPGNTALVFPNTNPFTITANTTPASTALNLECTVTGAAGSQQITCAPKGNTPALADGVLPAGYTGTLSFWVKVNESVTGGTIVANPANITSAPGGTQPATPDPNPGNNTSVPTSTVVIAASQLAISKAIQSATFATSPPSPSGAVVPGTFLTYRITVVNNGPSDVSNLRVLDVLPATLEASVNRFTGVKYISVTQSGGFGTTFTCSPPTGINPQNNPNGNGGTLQCTAPLMSATAPNNTATIDVTVFIDPATKVDLVNRADANATTNNFNQPVSATFTLTTPVGPTSDLALTKTHAPDPVVAGTEFEYTVTLTNNGPSTAQMVSLVDTFPPFQKVLGVQVLQTPDLNGAPNFTCTATPAIGAPGNTTSLTCTAPELPPNKKQDGTTNPAGTVSFKIRVLQDPFTPQPAPTSYQNCVSATSMSFDPVAANSTNVCDTVNVIFRADLSITKTDSPDPVIAGNLLTYTVTATNAGPSAALNFKITDPLPPGTVFISAAASAGATLITPAVATNGTVTATWNAAGGTPGGLTGPGVTRTLTIVVRVCPDYEQSFLPTGKAMCQPNLTDTATVSSDTVDPNPANNTATAETTVQAQSDLSIGKTGPSQANYSTTNNNSIVTYTLNFSNAGPSNAAGVEVRDVLPKGFTLVSWSSTVPGTTLNPDPPAVSDGVQTLVFKLGVLGAANQCTTSRPTSGTITIRALVPIKHPTITVTNSAAISTTNCLADPNLANNAASFDTGIVPPPFNPGVPYPALSEVSDQKEGSILFFPIYTSDAANANTQNTRISITNTSPTERVVVHLFAVDGSSCAPLDAFICLTPNQTAVFLASDFDPGNTGYLMAIAVDSNNGLPIAFNELIGDEYVKFSTGHQANLGAEAIAATMMFPGGTNPNVTTTTLRFDGISYNRLPRVLAADNIQSPADGNTTLLIVNRVGGNFTLSGALVGGLTGLLFDDQEQGLSFTTNPGTCQFRSVLSNTFPRTFTPFTRVIPAGRTGWMKFWGVDDARGSNKALFGAIINFNPTANASAGAFNQGHNLHKLTLTDNAEIIVPVFIPTC